MTQWRKKSIKMPDEYDDDGQFDTSRNDYLYHGRFEDTNDDLSDDRDEDEDDDWLPVEGEIDFYRDDDKLVSDYN